MHRVPLSAVVITMGAVALSLSIALYLVVAADYARTGRSGLAVAFVCYAAANAGFLWDLVRR